MVQKILMVFQYEEASGLTMSNSGSEMRISKIGLHHPHRNSIRIATREMFKVPSVECHRARIPTLIN